MDDSQKRQAPRTFEEMQGRIRDAAEMRSELQRRWRKSLWRVLPAPIIAYLVVGSYNWYVDTPDPWLRALAPVAAILVFNITTPVVQNQWFTRMRRKIARKRHLDI